MIDQTEYFYSEAAHKVSSIPGSWGESVRAAQRELLLAQGFLPIRDYSPPKSQLPFALVEDAFTHQADGTFLCTRTERAMPIRLSQDKLLRHPTIQARLDDLMASLTADAALADWWAHDMRYLRGSPVAQKAMAAFGLTQVEMEQIVLACRR